MNNIFRVCKPVCNILNESKSELQRQMLLGDGFKVTKIIEGWAYGKRIADDYSGIVAEDNLSNWVEPTNRVCRLGAHIYPDPNMKAVPLAHLPYQSEITIINKNDSFFELDLGGYISQMQIELIANKENDFVKVAERYLGIPYLWGGNSQYGIDCSGLISAALRGAGLNCPGDSIEQEAELGHLIQPNVPLLRGDLIFWSGHVGLMLSESSILHANAHHMVVSFEPLKTARDRILKNGGGLITAIKRIAIGAN